MTEEKVVKDKKKSASKEHRRLKDSSSEVHYHYHTDNETEGFRPEQPRAIRRPETRSKRKEKDKAAEVHHHYYYEPPRIRYQRSSKPAIAGALLIIVGILGILTSIIFMIGGSFVGGMGSGFDFGGGDAEGDVFGQITLIDGTPVENATVSIVGEPISTQTDVDGNYILYNVPSGDQEIKVEKEGYNTIIYKTFVNPENPWDGSDAENRCNFEIEPGTEVEEMGMHTPWHMIGGIMAVCAVLIIIFSIWTLLGGIYAIQRKSFAIALSGSVLGIFTIGFLVGSLLAFVAIFILVLARDEFKFERQEEPRNTNNY